MKQILTKRNGTWELGMAIQRVWLQEQKSLARQLWSANESAKVGTKHVGGLAWPIQPVTHVK